MNVCVWPFVLLKFLSSLFRSKFANLSFLPVKLCSGGRIDRALLDGVLFEGILLDGILLVGIPLVGILLVGILLAGQPFFQQVFSIFSAYFSLLTVANHLLIGWLHHCCTIF